MKFSRLMLQLICAVCCLFFAVATAEAWVTNSYGKDKDLAGRNSVLVLTPHLFVGPPMFEHHPLPEGTLAFQIVSNAVVKAAENTLRGKGYRVTRETELPQELRAAPDYQQVLGESWDAIETANATKKMIPRKIKPYSLKFLTDLLSGSSAELFVFVQCYGAFDDKTPIPVKAGVEVGTSVAGAVVTALTMNSIAFFGSGDPINFKITVIDGKTGDLIWFLEKYINGTDVRGQGALMEVFEKTFKDEFPNAEQPYVEAKFKKKRSEIHQTEGEG